jgi:hypothetical protein
VLIGLKPSRNAGQQTRHVLVNDAEDSNLVAIAAIWPERCSLWPNARLWKSFPLFRVPSFVGLTRKSDHQVSIKPIPAWLTISSVTNHLTVTQGFLTRDKYEILAPRVGGPGRTQLRLKLDQLR